MSDVISAAHGKNRRRMRSGAVLSVFSALIWLAQAYIIAWCLGGLLSDPQAVTIGIPIAGFLILALVRVGLDIWAQRELSLGADKIITHVRDRILDKEAVASDSSVIGGNGALGTLYVEKLEVLRPYLLRYAPAMTRAKVIPFIILAICAWQSWAVALVLIIAGPLIPVFMALVGWAAKAASERQMVEIGTLNDMLADRLAALSDLRFIGADDHVLSDFTQASDSLRERTMAVLKVAFLSSTVLELFSALGVAMVAIWVGFSLLGEVSWGSWGAELSIVSGIYMLILAPEYFQPLRDLAAAWHDRAAALAVSAEIDTWDAQDRRCMVGTRKPIEHSQAPLTFSQITSRGLVHRGIYYPDFTLQRGQSVALIGPSGSGKSTLLRMLAGLERPDQGDVLIDGQVLDETSVDAWRQNLGWMPQSPHFLTGSLRYNITFGPKVSPIVIEAASLDQVLARLPKSDQTTLGERGAGLSGGEGRRVTLARALHGAPEIVLVDEPTADLDADTAGHLIESFVKFKQHGGTLVIATHDAAVLSHVDHVIDLGGYSEGTV